MGRRTRNRLRSSGALWGNVVARSWEQAVRSSMKAIITESERRSAEAAESAAPSSRRLPGQAASLRIDVRGHAEAANPNGVAAQKAMTLSARAVQSVSPSSVERWAPSTSCSSSSPRASMQVPHRPTVAPRLSAEATIVRCCSSLRGLLAGDRAADGVGHQEDLDFLTLALGERVCESKAVVGALRSVGGSLSTNRVLTPTSVVIVRPGHIRNRPQRPWWRRRT